MLSRFKSIALFIIGRRGLEWPWKVITFQRCRAESSPLTVVVLEYAHTDSEQPTAEETTELCILAKKERGGKNRKKRTCFTWNITTCSSRDISSFNKINFNI